MINYKSLQHKCDDILSTMTAILPVVTWLRAIEYASVKSFGSKNSLLWNIFCLSVAAVPDEVYCWLTIAALAPPTLSIASRLLQTQTLSHCSYCLVIHFLQAVSASLHVVVLEHIKSWQKHHEHQGRLSSLTMWLLFRCPLSVRLSVTNYSFIHFLS